MSKKRGSVKEMKFLPIEDYKHFITLLDEPVDWELIPAPTFSFDREPFTIYEPQVAVYDTIYNVFPHSHNAKDDATIFDSITAAGKSLLDGVMSELALAHTDKDSSKITKFLAIDEYIDVEEIVQQAKKDFWKSANETFEDWEKSPGWEDYIEESWEAGSPLDEATEHRELRGPVIPKPKRGILGISPEALEKIQEQMKKSLEEEAEIISEVHSKQDRTMLSKLDSAKELTVSEVFTRMVLKLLAGTTMTLGIIVILLWLMERGGFIP